ncbi:MAG: hypothetical protein N4A65_07650 [Cohaesibacter sp.]|nr:hypothetical protein [Cohaesibacter sp.]
MADFYGAFREMVGLCFYEPTFFESPKGVTLEDDNPPLPACARSQTNSDLD